MDQSSKLSDLYGRHVVLSGGGDAALAKLKLLAESRAHLSVFAKSPSKQIEDWAERGKITLIRRALQPGDAQCSSVFYAADDDPIENARTLEIARADGALVNAEVRSDGSACADPLMENTDPISDAFGMQSSDTVFARMFRSRPGHVSFVGAGPGDPDLLTMKAYRVLNEADVVIYDRLVSQPILELARCDALMVNVGKEGFGPSIAQAEINRRLVAHAASGAQVVRLKSGDATIFGRLDEEIDALDQVQVGWSIVPGITSASAAVAAIGQSLTKRERNASVRFLTGHDMKGFADHDWAALARKGEVAAIYMGKKSARFIQGRLIMHGADRHTPVTIIENASRPDQRIVETTLGAFPAALAAAQITGPALTFYGLAPRKIKRFGDFTDATSLHPAQEAL